ncbi:MAG TPA: hypothetical protein VEQ60_21360, partial [Longimicrobium sp.]|nr:hypothetical protein [Longimicrobium sp.]
VNKMLYQPNVSGLAIVHDSLFATLRNYGWSTRLQGHGGNRYIDDWPRTALEVFDRRGRVRSSFALPGKGYELVSDDHARVAVLVRNLNGSRTLLIGRLPK